MYSYITEELHSLVFEEFPLDSSRVSITGHSMGRYSCDWYRRLIYMSRWSWSTHSLPQKSGQVQVCQCILCHCQSCQLSMGKKGVHRLLWRRQTRLVEATWCYGADQRMERQDSWYLDWCRMLTLMFERNFIDSDTGYWRQLLQARPIIAREFRKGGRRSWCARCQCALPTREFYDTDVSPRLTIWLGLRSQLLFHLFFWRGRHFSSRLGIAAHVR